MTVARLCAGRFLELVRADNKWEWCQRLSGRQAVFVLAIIDYQDIVLVSNFRHPINSQEISLPAGLVADLDSSESVELAAKRELEEEAGYSATDIVTLCTGASSAGLTNEPYSIVLATGLTKTGPGGGVPGENITVYTQPLWSLTTWMNQQQAAGFMVDPKIYAALFLWSGYLQEQAMPSGAADSKFRGRDRRLISQTWRNLRAIILRDQKAFSPKKTTSLSTRDFMLDNNYTLMGETFDANALLVQLRNDYFAPSAPPVYDGPWPPPVGS